MHGHNAKDSGNRHDLSPACGERLQDNLSRAPGVRIYGASALVRAVQARDPTSISAYPIRYRWDKRTPSYSTETKGPESGSKIRRARSHAASPLQRVMS